MRTLQVERKLVSSRTAPTLLHDVETHDTYQAVIAIKLDIIIITSTQRNLVGISVVLKALLMATGTELVTQRTAFCRVQRIKSQQS